MLHGYNLLKCSNASCIFKRIIIHMPSVVAPHLLSTMLQSKRPRAAGTGHRRATGTQSHRPPHSETPPDGTNLNQECKLAADSGAFRPYTSMHRSHSFGSLLPAQAYTLTALVDVSGRLCRPFLTALVYVTQTGLVYVALRESRALAET